MVWEFSPLVGADDGDSPPSTDAQLACLRIRFIIALRELSSTICQSVIKAMRPCVRIRFIMILTNMMMIMVMMMTLMSVDSNFYLAQQVQVASIIDRAHHC